ncbi:MAG: hypothetical protein ACLPNY_18660, partial [Roseiarcus sp.]
MAGVLPPRRRFVGQPAHRVIPPIGAPTIGKNLAGPGFRTIRRQRAKNFPLSSIHENLDFQAFPKLFLAEMWNIRSLRPKKFGNRVFFKFRSHFPESECSIPVDRGALGWRISKAKQGEDITAPDFQEDNVVD